MLKEVIGAVPKRRFARGTMVEISPELDEFFKKHPEELKNIYSQLNDKVREYDRAFYMYREIAVNARKNLKRLREKYKTLRALKVGDPPILKVNSINIPKEAFMWGNREKLTPELFLLYGIVLDCRLDALLNKQLDSNGVVYITQEDINKKCDSFGLQRLARRAHPKDPLPIELLAKVFLVFIEDTRIYVKVFPEETFETPANFKSCLFV